MSTLLVRRGLSPGPWSVRRRCAAPGLVTDTFVPADLCRQPYWPARRSGLSCATRTGALQGSVAAQSSGGRDVRNEMHRDEIKALFDRQAAGYDAQWAKTSPIRDCLHLLLDSMFAGLPKDARILCVGAGTGAELAHLARNNPAWRFTAVDPSGSMLEVCRQRAESEGFAMRCNFHAGYLETLAAIEEFDAATCFLVSQFILDQQARIEFFQEISRKLKPGGILASSDLASDVQSSEYEVLLRAWMHMMAVADISPDGIERLRKAYAHDVGVLPPDRIASMIESGGFEPPVRFFQAGLIHAWSSKRVPDPAGAWRSHA